MHVIAAKAVALRIAATEEFRARQRQTIANARAFAEELIAGGLDVLTGRHRRPPRARRRHRRRLRRQAPPRTRLEEIGITVNRNAIPFDERPPMNPSGLRIGTPALTTRGLDEDDMREIARDHLRRPLRLDYEGEREALQARTRALVDGPPALSAALGSDRLRIWVDCTAAAHPVVLRPVIALLRGARPRGLRSRRATTGRPRACSIASASNTSRSAATPAPAPRAKALALAARSAALARWAAAARFDLAIAHGSVDVAVVGTVLRIPQAQMQDYEYAGLQRKLAWRAARRVIVPDAIPIERLEAAGATSREAGPLPGPQGGLLPRRLRARPGRARRARPRRARRRGRAQRRRPRPRRRPPAARDLRLPRRQSALRAA